MRFPPPEHLLIRGHSEAMAGQGPLSSTHVGETEKAVRARARHFPGRC